MELPASARLDPWLLLAAAAAPWLPAPLAMAWLAGLAVLWWRSGPPRRELRWGLSVLLLAALALAGGWALERGWLGGEREPEAARRYAALWSRLEDTAERTVIALDRPPDNAEARRAAFTTLAEPALLPEGSRLTLLLLDPDGEAVAWAGEGLVHELAPDRLPVRGSDFRVSFGAVSLLAVRPLGPGSRPWRVVAGAGLRADEIPFAGRGPLAPPGGRWSIVAADEIAPAACRVLPSLGRPSLVLCPEARGADVARSAGGARRLAWAMLGAGLAALTVLRTLALALLWGTVVPRRQRPWEVALLGLGAIVALAAAAGIGGRELGVLVTALGLAVGGTAASRLATRRAAVWIGALGGGALLAVAVALQRAWGPRDLAESWFGGADVVALRLALFGLAACSLARLCEVRARPVRRSSEARDGDGGDGHAASGPQLATGAAVDRVSDRVVAPAWAALFEPGRLAWLAAGLVLLAAALADHALPAAAAILLAGALVAPVLAAGSRARAGLWIPLALFAAAWSAAAWQVAYRAELRRALPDEVRDFGPPDLAALRGAAVELHRYFARLDLAASLPRPLAGVDTGDLAFDLWRRSPLARREALSALVLLPADGAPPSSFDYGLPLTDRLELDREPSRWTELAPTLWRDLLIAGEVEIAAGGRVWGRARYWLLPRPGFGHTHDRLRVPSAELLAGRPTLRNPAEELPGAPRWALYAPEAQVLYSPWRETPPPLALLPPAGAPVARVSTPDGPAWVATRRSEAGLDALFLPALAAADGLERVAVQALAVLLPVALAVLLVLLLALPRAASRDWALSTVRSYSRRLVLVYTLLLLVPLLSLYAVLASGVADWLTREQRVSGEAALNAAQRVLAEYLLALEPGFGLDTALDDDLLTWLSRVVQHDVNLYWGSGVWASSKHELFTAGLLSRRIPGEVYARLALYGDPLASRTSRLADARFLELYAPLKIPGVPAGRGRLFLSLPLLAEQRELAVELAHLRRRALAGTAALFLLLVAVGQRLARNFTRPLTELVRGTQLIAAGARSLEHRPAELELAALSEAIDAMARHIAEARERLVREKQVVERIVDNVTSGVVSLDYAGRVALANRVARELLGVEPGASLVEALTAAELAPVADFVIAAGNALHQATVQLPPVAGEVREWNLVWVPIAGAGDPASLLVVEDATQVLRGQRLAAWAEMARLIAHEIKNPLTPIRLSTEHLREAWHRDRDHFSEVFERCTANILRQVEELRQIAGEFSTYSQIPRLDRQPDDLARVVREVVDGYRSGAAAGVPVELDLASPEVPARIDRRLLGRAVRNLIENAVRACGDAGRVRVELAASAEEARIVVGDQGPGVPPEMLSRIFEPYFSTHAGGTGLGLPIARRIAEEHGGTLLAKNLAGGGLEVTITIPRQ